MDEYNLKSDSSILTLDKSTMKHPVIGDSNLKLDYSMEIKDIFETEGFSSNVCNGLTHF